MASRGKWTPAKHFRFLNEELKSLAHSQDGRLIIPIPRRHGKSTFCSVYFPAWFLGTYPDRRVILASFEGSLAASFGRKVRDLLDEWGPGLWGIRVNPKSSAAADWNIEGHEGGMRCAGIGGAITGRGSDLLCIDDFCKDAEQALSPVYREKAWDWFISTARATLEPGGRILLPNTRWHPEDLIGRLLSAREDKWKVIKLPAYAEANDPLGRVIGEPLWPGRVPAASLKEIELDIGPVWFQAEFQQNPQPEGGTEWPTSWFGPSIWFDDWPSTLSLKVMSLDPSKGADSKSGDYSAWVLLGKHPDGTLYVDADLARRDCQRIVDDGAELYLKFGPCDGVVFEINTFQELLRTDFDQAMQARNLTYHPYGFNNTIKKDVRIRRLTPLLSRGKIRFKANSPGAKLLVEQLKQFPTAQHDDGPDALEQACRLLQEIEHSHAVRTYPTRIRV